MPQNNNESVLLAGDEQSLILITFEIKPLESMVVEENEEKEKELEPIYSQPLTTAGSPTLFSLSSDY